MKGIKLGRRLKIKENKISSRIFFPILFSALLLLMCYFTLNTSDNTSCFDPKGLFAP